MSIHRRVPIDTSKPATLEQLGNQSKPTAREKSALSFMVAEWERCLAMAAEWRKQNYAPEVDALYESYRVELKSIFADLYGGKLTFGDVAKARANMDVDYKFKLIAISAPTQLQAGESESDEREAPDAYCAYLTRRIQAQIFRRVFLGVEQFPYVFSLGKLAEAVRFELTEDLTPRRFSRPVP